MTRCASIGWAAALLLNASVSSAQSTSDGIAALARGDTTAALRILKPLADSPTDPDPLAQFILGLMYDSGVAGAIDQIRACSLYSKSAVAPNPFAEQASLLADATNRERHPVVSALCNDAAAGVWRDPSPASFTLGPDHWVTADAGGLTVGYRGELAVATSLGGVEWVFLPTRYTWLDVTRPAVTRRHFIEFRMWLPDNARNPSGWALVWVVYEVVGLQARPVGDFVTVATAMTGRPPASYPLEASGRLEVDADGGVVRVVPGPNPQTIAVPYPGNLR